MKFLTFSKIYLIFCGLIYTIASVRFLGTEIYGLVSFLVGLCYTFDFLFSGKFEINILRSQNSNFQLIEGVLKASTILSLSILILLITIFYLEFIDFYFCFFPLISLFSGIQALLQMEVNKNYDLRILGFNNILVGTSNVFFGITLVYLFQESGFFLAILLNLILSVFFYLRKIKFNLLSSVHAKPIFFWKNKFKNIVSSFSKTAFTDVFPIFIKLYFEPYILGLYQLSVKFIKTGLFFTANLLGNYFVKVNWPLKTYPKLIGKSLIIYFLLMITYWLIYTQKYYIEFTNLIIGNEAKLFVEYSIYFLSIFMLDSIFVSLSSFLIRLNVNTLTFIRIFQLIVLGVFFLFENVKFELVTIIVSSSFALSLSFSALIQIESK